MLIQLPQWLSLLFAALIALGLSSCAGSTDSTEVRLYRPDNLRQTSAVDPVNMFVLVSINSGVNQRFAVDPTNSNQTVNILGIRPGEENNISVRWFETVNFSDVILSEQLQTFVADGNTIINAQHNYNFDEDEDGRTNWIERVEGTCVFSDVQQCAINTDNLIINSDFDSLNQGWFSNLGNSPEFSNGEYCLSTTTDDIFNYQGQLIHQAPLTLEATEYLLTYDIRAESQSEVEIELYRYNEDESFTVVAARPISVSTGYTTKTERFIFQQRWDRIQLTFSFGNGQINRYCIDNVSMAISQ